jgi:hypothetical protein
MDKTDQPVGGADSEDRSESDMVTEEESSAYTSTTTSPERTPRECSPDRRARVPNLRRIGLPLPPGGGSVVSNLRFSLPLGSLKSAREEHSGQQQQQPSTSRRSLPLPAAPGEQASSRGGVHTPSRQQPKQHAGFNTAMPPLAAPSPRPHSIAVELLSPALVFPKISHGIAQIREQCSQKLGVAAERFRFYALTEVANLQDLPPNCTRVAMDVASSSEWTICWCSCAPACLGALL